MRIEVEAGYEGRYRTAQWFPITVTISNDGPDVRGVLEWHFPGQSGSSVFQREIDLPRGARKRLLLNAFSNEFARSGELRLLVGRNKLTSQFVQLNPADPGQFMVGVLSSDPSLLNSLAAMNIANASGVSVAHLRPDLVADQAVALAGLDAIFVHDIATADLRPEQRAALNLWVYLGGQLVVGGGANAEQTTSGVTDLLPVTVGDLVADVPLDSLARLAQRGGAVGASTVTRVDLRPGAAALDASSLISGWPVGSGRVIYTAFDLNALRAWSGEPSLWAQVLQAGPRFDPAAIYRWQSDDLLRNALQLPALRLPSFWVLAGFVLSYIVIIGPVNFLVLRRMRRVDLAWLTVPALVALFVVGTYGASLLLRGSRPLITQLTVVQGFENQTRGQATAFMNIFSPQRTTYSVELAGEALVSSSRLEGRLGASEPLIWTESNTIVQDALVDVSSLRTFVIEQAVDLRPQVESTLQRERRQVSGEVRNTGGEPLLDALLVYGDSVQRLGTLDPGASQAFQIRRDQGNFPNNAGAPTEGLINRQNVLVNLFDFNQFGFTGAFGPNVQPTQGIPDRDGVYLLGWREQPGLDLRINGGALASQGLTLYMIRLDG